MKNVLWISRHTLTEEQMVDLEKICHGSVSFTQIQESITDIHSIAPIIAASDVIACVLPTHLLAELVALASGKPVLVEECIRTMVYQKDDEPKVIFRHGCWKMIKKLEYEVCSPDIL